MIMKFWAVFLVFVMLMVTPTCAMQLPENMDKDTNIRNLDYKLPNFNSRTDSYQNVNRKQIVNHSNKDKFVKNNICNSPKSGTNVSGSVSRISTPLVTNDVSDPYISALIEEQQKIRTNASDLSPKIREFYKNQTNLYSQLLSHKKVLITKKNKNIHVRDNLKDELDNFVLTTGNRQVYDKIHNDYTNSVVILEKNEDEINKTENLIMCTAKKIQHYKNSLDALDALQISKNDNQNVKSALYNYNNNINSIQESEKSLSIDIKPENDFNPESETDIKSTSIINKNNINNLENTQNNTNDDIVKFDNSRLIPLLIGTGLGSGGVMGLGIGLGTVAYSKISFHYAIDNLIETVELIKKSRVAYESSTLEMSLGGCSSSAIVPTDITGCAEVMTYTAYLDSATSLKGCYKTGYLLVEYEAELTSMGNVITIVSAIVIVLAITALIVYLGIRFGWWNKLLK
jgi:hypothetical protein